MKNFRAFESFNMTEPFLFEPSVTYDADREVRILEKSGVHLFVQLKKLLHLTFRGPRIVIYSYNKNQRDALIYQIYPS